MGTLISRRHSTRYCWPARRSNATSSATSLQFLRSPLGSRDRRPKDTVRGLLKQRRQFVFALPVDFHGFAKVGPFWRTTFAPSSADWRGLLRGFGRAYLRP